MPRLKCIKNVVCDAGVLSSIRCMRLPKSHFVHISLGYAEYLCDDAGTLGAQLYAVAVPRRRIVIVEFIHLTSAWPCILRYTNH